MLLQGRVDPAIKERADRGAAARGVTIARYLEILIEGDKVADAYVEPGSCEQLDLGVSAWRPHSRLRPREGALCPDFRGVGNNGARKTR